MAVHGWTPREVSRRSGPAGDPARTVSFSTIYGILESDRVPNITTQFELASTFGVSPTMIWGRTPLPPEVEAKGVRA
jgi:hypothetical protein